MQSMQQHRMQKQMNLMNVWNKNKPSTTSMIQDEDDDDDDDDNKEYTLQSRQMQQDDDDNDEDDDDDDDDDQQMVSHPQISVQIPSNFTNDAQRSASAPPPIHIPFESTQGQSQTPTSYHFTARHNPNEEESKTPSWGFDSILLASGEYSDWINVRDAWQKHMPSGKERINPYNPSETFHSPGPPPTLTMTEQTKKDRERKANQSKITKKYQMIKQIQKEKEKEKEKQKEKEKPQAQTMLNDNQ